ncbi:MAG: prepilin-type N-terminal cleavage/methylation domain-containing protein [Proteobacteria bacterium]|nr:prepilin-type N-terminal cleavage/methylation domain-containing protein [Pseudomonadota bacterium]
MIGAPRHRGRYVEGGFTLLEAIVTLVIFAMIIAVLMQSLQQALKVRERVYQHQQATRADELQSDWFRDTLAGTIAPAAGEGQALEGTRTSLAVTTQSPLEGQYLERITWLLKPVQGGDDLRYASAGRPEIVVMPGPLADAGFAYLGGDDQWHDKWQPTPDNPVRLPKAIRFQARTTGGQILWIVAVAAEKRPKSLLLPKGL